MLTSSASYSLNLFFFVSLCSVFFLCLFSSSLITFKLPLGLPLCPVSYRLGTTNFTPHIKENTRKQSRVSNLLDSTWAYTYAQFQHTILIPLSLSSIIWIMTYFEYSLQCMYGFLCSTQGFHDHVKTMKVFETDQICVFDNYHILLLSIIAFILPLSVVVLNYNPSMIYKRCCPQTRSVWE